MVDISGVNEGAMARSRSTVLARLVKVMALGHTGRAGEVAEWLKAAVC
jgi:hypothetical protein